MFLFIRLLDLDQDSYKVPGWFSGKESTYQCRRYRRDTGSIPGSGRSSRVGNGNPLQYSCLENSMYRGAWQVTVHGGHKESDTTEHDDLNHHPLDFQNFGLRASVPLFSSFRLSHIASFPGSPASRCQTVGLLSLHNQTSNLYQISFNVCLLACLPVCLSVYLSILLVLFLWRPLIKAVKLFCMIQVIIQNV